jgi:hypothetical protein
MILTEKQVSQSEYSQKWRGSDRELFSSFFSLLSRPTAIGSFLADEKKKRYTLDVIRFCFFKNFVILSIVCETNEKNLKKKNQPRGSVRTNKHTFYLMTEEEKGM